MLMCSLLNELMMSELLLSAQVPPLGKARATANNCMHPCHRHLFCQEAGPEEQQQFLREHLANQETGQEFSRHTSCCM